jgi:glycosyltransferase involved in cell wall biosynthesis
MMMRGVTMVLWEGSKALGISDQVHMMGFRSPVEPPMAGRDLMPVPALDEPFVRTPVETTRAGAPLVAVKSGGHMESIKDSATGWLAQPDGPETLGQGALCLLHNPASAQGMVPEGRRNTKQMLSISTRVERITQLDEEILALPSVRTHSDAGRNPEPQAAG